MQKFDKNSLFMPEYDDMIRGINITPKQNLELKNLYARSTLSTRPWAFVFAGGMVVDMVSMVWALGYLAKTGDKKIIAGYVMFLTVQLIAVIAQGYRMKNAEKQLINKINEIKIQNKGR